MLDLSGLADLDLAGLEAIALLYEQTARGIRLRISEKRGLEEIRAASRKDLADWQRAMLRMAQIMIVKMEDGASAEAAIKSTSMELGEDEKKLAHILKRHLRKQKTANRDQRRIMVIRLAQSGWTNERIGLELGIHANTVSRDLKRALDR